MLHLIALLALFASGSLTADDSLAFASGSWYDPGRNGEGFVVQVIPGERAIVTWFTYPPDGESGEQAWLIGQGVTSGNRIVIDEMLRPVGATFGDGFDPGSVMRQIWGSLEITFADCNSASVNWAGPAEFGSGSMNLVRLSFIDDLECEPETVPVPDRIIAGRSGAWYDPSHDGEGWMIEALPDGRMVVYWFTYDDQGRQAWLIGQAKIEGRTLWVDDMQITQGAHFGDAFRAEDVVLETWGEFGFLFEDCSEAQMRYESGDERFGEGSLTPVHLAQLTSTSCADPPPAEPLTAGTWRLSTNMPVPMSETASASAGGFVYTAGGIGTFSRFERFDPVSGSHQEMPELPGPRHHPMMTSDGHALYLAGGFQSKFGLENPGNNFWKYDPDADAWETLPNLPRIRAAGAALYLHGRVWVLGGEGMGTEIMSYNPGMGDWTLYPGDPRMVVDHMQAVAFENEIWWMGGRTFETTNKVLIWNPVTLAWRDGPPMNHRRAGLAARVVQGQIMVSGGEVIDIFPGQVTPSLEVFAPGADAWVFGAASPVAVHGTTGAVVNGEFVLPGGSDIAGDTSQNRATQVFKPATAGTTGY